MGVTGSDPDPNTRAAQSGLCALSANSPSAPLSEKTGRKDPGPAAGTPPRAASKDPERGAEGLAYYKSRFHRALHVLTSGCFVPFTNCPTQVADKLTSRTGLVDVLVFGVLGGGTWPAGEAQGV